MDGIVRKLEAKYEDVPNAPDPTESELAALRDRYLEHKALGENTEALRRLQDDPRVEIAAIFLKFFYRLTLFAAAAVILYRATMGWISN